MSQERRRNRKLVQSRRHNPLEEADDVESGPAIIDDSASEANSEDDLQLSGSDNDDDEEEQEPPQQNPNHKIRYHSTGSSISPRAPECYDHLTDDTLQGVVIVDLEAPSGSVDGAAEKLVVNDTAIMLNGFKDITNVDGKVEEETAMHFDELDDSISFEPRPSHAKSTSTSSSARGIPPSKGGDRPDRESYWQRRNRDKEEYKKRLEDPTFTPYVGEFFMHDSRKRRQFDSLNQFGSSVRGRGRGRGFRGNGQRETITRNDLPQEPLWGHDGFEELEPQQSQFGSSKVCSVSVL